MDEATAAILRRFDLAYHRQRNALTIKINAVLQDIDQGLYQQALDKLQSDILAKTDGGAKLGAPDKNDWLIACVAQGQADADRKFSATRQGWSKGIGGAMTP